jgi:murein DD-endopeptidase MepM/ murein hydrolase activator NlpD
MLRKRYYIIFVSRDEHGELRKIPLPTAYAFLFVGAALFGALTIALLAGSYTRMLMKTERFNQVRSEHEALQKNFQKMETLAHERDVQAASLGSLANEVTALYGLKQSKLPAAAIKGASKVDTATAALTPASDDLTPQGYTNSLDQFYNLRSQALSGRITRALEVGGSPGLLTMGGTGNWLDMADAPSLWPLEGRVTSSFGQRQDPFNGEGAFHSGIDISAPIGTPVRAAADGAVEEAGMESGYGREILLNHGHDIETRYGHLSGFAVVAGQQVKRGQVIGYVGMSGRSTGAHLHYEVRIHHAPVNPHKYLRLTYSGLGDLAVKPGV